MKPRIELLSLLPPLHQWHGIKAVYGTLSTFQRPSKFTAEPQGPSYSSPVFSFGKELWASCLVHNHLYPRAWHQFPLFSSQQRRAVRHTLTRPTNPSTQGAHEVRFLTIVPLQVGGQAFEELGRLGWAHTGQYPHDVYVTSHLHHLYFVLEISKVRPHVAMKETIMLTMSYKCINLWIWGERIE